MASFLRSWETAHLPTTVEQPQKQFKFFDSNDSLDVHRARSAGVDATSATGPAAEYFRHAARFDTGWRENQWSPSLGWGQTLEGPIYAIAGFHDHAEQCTAFCLLQAETDPLDKA